MSIQNRSIIIDHRHRTLTIGINMRVALSIALLTSLLASCTTPAVKAPDKSPWEAFGYKGMAEEVNLLAGDESLNCGIHNRLNTSDPVNSHMTQADSKQCIKNAISTQTPFRYGSVRIPIDSYLFDALVLSKPGQYWIVKYDAMLDGASAQRFIERCGSIRVNYDTLQYQGISCQKVDEVEWQEALRQSALIF